MDEPLKVGSKCKTGQTVVLILGCSKAACCYTTEDNHLRWEFYENEGQVPPQLMPAISKFDNLMAQIKVYMPKEIKESCYHQLAKALFSVLDTQDPSKIDEFFAPVEMFITQIKLGPLYYIFSGLSTSLIIIIGLLFFLFKISYAVVCKDYILASLCGVSGASLSILQRGSKLDIQPLAGRMILMLQGMSRILIGALFGVFTFLLVQGDFILGFVQSKQETVLALTFLAGFSERFIPEITKAIERRILKENKDNA